MLIKDDRPCDDGFAKLIAHSCVAAACEDYARREPLAAPGLRKAAEKHRALAGGAMLKEFLSASGPTRETAGALISPRGLGGATGADMTE